MGTLKSWLTGAQRTSCGNKEMLFKCPEEAEVMAQSAKCFPCTAEDLSRVPSTHIKSRHNGPTLVLEKWRQ